jgi:hypothetical protein
VVNPLGDFAAELRVHLAKERLSFPMPAVLVYFDIVLFEAAPHPPSGQNAPLTPGGILT